MFNEDQKKHIIEVLDNKFQNLNKPISCPMCGNGKFTLAGGYFVSILQDNVNNIALGGSSLPTVSIICTNCGFVSQHAVGLIGLLPKKEEKKDGKDNDKENKGGE
jgi:hypothetical protein